MRLPAMYHTQPVPGMTWLTTGYLLPRKTAPWSVIRDRLARERALLTRTQEQFEAIVAANYPLRTVSYVEA